VGGEKRIFVRSGARGWASWVRVEHDPGRAGLGLAVKEGRVTLFQVLFYLLRQLVTI
jgi:hypothetical protein